MASIFFPVASIHENRSCAFSRVSHLCFPCEFHVSDILRELLSCIFLSTSFLPSFYELLRSYINTVRNFSIWTFSSCLRTARFSSRDAKQRYAECSNLPTNTRNSESHLIACVDIETKRGDRSESERRFSCPTAGFCTRVALVYTTIKCLHLCLS